MAVGGTCYALNFQGLHAVVDAATDTVDSQSAAQVVAAVGKMQAGHKVTVMASMSCAVQQAVEESLKAHEQGRGSMTRVQWRRLAWLAHGCSFQYPSRLPSPRIAAVLERPDLWRGVLHDIAIGSAVVLQFLSKRFNMLHISRLFEGIDERECLSA